MNSLNEDLKAYLDGELPEARRMEIEDALAQSNELREELEFLQLIGRSLQASARPIPVQGAEKVLAPRPRFWQRPVLVWAVGAASCALLAALVFPRLTSATVKSKAPSLDAGRVAVGMQEQLAPSAAAPAESLQYEAAKRPMDPQYNMRAKSLSAGPGAPADGVASFSALQNRQIIRNAFLTIRVETVRDSARKVEAAARKYGGFVSNSTISENEDNPSASLEIRIDSRRMTDALNELRALGRVREESSSGADVTEQVVDMEARIKTLRAEEDSLRTLLSRATKIGDILQIKDRLTQVRSTIESFTQQARSLKDAASLATISVTLEQAPKAGEKPKNPDWANDAWANALIAMGALGQFLGTLLIYLAVFSVVWIPVGLVVWLLARRKPRA